LLRVEPAVGMEPRMEPSARRAHPNTGKTERRQRHRDAIAAELSMLKDSLISVEASALLLRAACHPGVPSSRTTVN